VCGGERDALFSRRSTPASSTATLASWYVDDVERVVDELTSKGIDFER
jgi:hypothetical protein